MYKLKRLETLGIWNTVNPTPTTHSNQLHYYYFTKFNLYIHYFLYTMFSDKDKAINGVLYLDELTNYCFPQLDELENVHQLHFHQYCVPPHFQKIG